MAKRGNPNFYKGMKALPGAGHPKKDPAFDRLLNSATVPALKELIAIKADPETPVAVKVDICKYIINRRHGCPATSMVDENGNNIAGQIVFIQLPVKDTGNGEKA